MENLSLGIGLDFLYFSYSKSSIYACYLRFTIACWRQLYKINLEILAELLKFTPSFMVISFIFSKYISSMPMRAYLSSFCLIMAFGFPVLFAHYYWLERQYTLFASKMLSHLNFFKSNPFTQIFLTTYFKLIGAIVYRNFKNFIAIITFCDSLDDIHHAFDMICICRCSSFLWFWKAI